MREGQYIYRKYVGIMNGNAERFQQHGEILINKYIKYIKYTAQQLDLLIKLLGKSSIRSSMIM